MPSPKYTKIEITSEAYLALEAEAILQSKTLKTLASEFILEGVSEKALEFTRAAATYSPEDNHKLNSKKIVKAMDRIGEMSVKIDETLSNTIQAILRNEGYVKAMLYVAQHTASLERDELHRIMAICDQYKLPPNIAAEIIKELNRRRSS